VLARAADEINRVRLDLTARLADAFERYESNRTLVEYYRDRILPDQVRIYRGAFARHQQEPERVGFIDVVNAQQGLAAALTGYLSSLRDQWMAVIDLANLLQVDDLSQVGQVPSAP